VVTFGVFAVAFSRRWEISMSVTPLKSWVVDFHGDSELVTPGLPRVTKLPMRVQALGGLD